MFGNRFGDELLRDLCTWVRDMADKIGTDHAAMSQARLDSMTMVPVQNDPPSCKHCGSWSRLAEFNKLRRLNAELNDQNVELAEKIVELKTPRMDFRALWAKLKSEFDTYPTIIAEMNRMEEREYRRVSE